MTVATGICEGDSMFSPVTPDPFDPQGNTRAYREGADAFDDDPLSLDVEQIVADRDEPALEHPAREFDVFDVVNLTTGAAGTTTIQTAYQPAWWHVSVVDAANVLALLYLGPHDSGVPIRLGPSGNAKIPGRGNYLTIRSAGASPVNLTVIASRGFDGIAVNRGSA